MLQENNLVDVWHVQLPLSDETMAILYGRLSHREKTRGRQWSVNSAHRQFVAGRGLLRHVLARQIGQRPEDIQLRYGKYGKPYLLDGNGLEFNLAHSKKCLLIAVAKKRSVGIDVEWIRSDTPVEVLAHRFFSPWEVAHLESLPPDDRQLAFFTVWTRKEAFVKATGRGIALGFHRFSVPVSPEEQPRLVDVDNRIDEGQEWSFTDIDVASGYVASVCAQGHGWRVRLRALVEGAELWKELLE